MYGCVYAVECRETCGLALSVVGHVSAQAIEDLERAIDLVLHRVVRSLCPFGKLVRPLQVHRELVLDGSDSAFRSSEPISHQPS